jgi:hypothetical protein
MAVMIWLAGALSACDGSATEGHAGGPGGRTASLQSGDLKAKAPTVEPATRPSLRNPNRRAELAGLAGRDLRLRAFGNIDSHAQSLGANSGSRQPAGYGLLRYLELPRSRGISEPMMTLRIEGRFANILNRSGNVADCFNPNLVSDEFSATVGEARETLRRARTSTYRTFISAPVALDADLECAANMPGPYLDEYEIQAVRGMYHISISEAGDVILFWGDGMFAVFEGR